MRLFKMLSMTFALLVSVMLVAGPAAFAADQDPKDASKEPKTAKHVTKKTVGVKKHSKKKKSDEKPAETKAS
jgi:hypothetical protein